ncbi:MAG: hypothetical protein ACK4UN_12415, partial [Limisphaerales bacterium]
MNAFLIWKIWGALNSATPAANPAARRFGWLGVAVPTSLVVLVFAGVFISVMVREARQARVDLEKQLKEEIGELLAEKRFTYSRMAFEYSPVLPRAFVTFTRLEANRPNAEPQPLNGGLHLTFDTPGICVVSGRGDLAPIQRTLMTPQARNFSWPRRVGSTEDERLLTAVAAAETINTNWGFSQEIERTVNDDGAGRDFFIDFDTATLHTPPADLRVSDTNAFLKWVESNGIDASGETGAGVRGLVGIGMSVRPIPSQRWDALTPEDVLNDEVLASGSPTAPAYAGIQAAFITAKGELPETYLFKTREGAMGVLQITGFAEEQPRGVKIRYKLVETARKKTDTALPPVELVLFNARKQSTNLVLDRSTAWKADGSLIQEKDRLFTPGEVWLQREVPPEARPLAMVVRVNNSDAAEPARIADLEFEGQKDAIASFSVVAKQKTNDDWIGLIRAFPAEQKTATLRLALAHGPYSSGPEPGKWWGSKGQIEFGNFTMGEVFDRKGNAAVHLAHDFTGCDFRLVAFPYSPKRSALERTWEKLKREVTGSHRNQQNSVVGRRLEDKKSGSQNLEVWEFPGLSAKDGAAVCLEVRPIRWMTLENVALEPGSAALRDVHEADTNRPHLKSLTSSAGEYKVQVRTVAGSKPGNSSAFKIGSEHVHSYETGGGQKLLDTARRYARQHGWKLEHESGNVVRDSVTVKLEYTDGSGKKVIFEEIRDRGLAKFKVTTEVGSELNANQIMRALTHLGGDLRSGNAKPETAPQTVDAQKTEFVLPFNPRLAQKVLDAARDFAAEHQWKHEGEHGRTSNDLEVVTISTRDLAGKMVSFTVTGDRTGRHELTVSVEPGSEFTAERVGIAIARRLNLAAGYPNSDVRTNTSDAVSKQVDPAVQEHFAGGDTNKFYY